MTRFEATKQNPNCQTSGECLLRLGQVARFLLRHGSAWDQIARELNIGSRVCELAVAFCTAPDWLKLRALVEDWNLLAIRTWLRAETTFGVRPIAYSSERLKLGLSRSAC